VSLIFEDAKRSLRAEHQQRHQRGVHEAHDSETHEGGRGGARQGEKIREKWKKYPPT
jgi:hypothetical protein